jgi:hypothetical protein
VRTIAAENLALRKQLMTLARHHKRSPKLTAYDRVIFGILASMMSIKRLSRIAIILKPAIILKFHHALVNKKYQWLFSAKTHRKPGLCVANYTFLCKIKLIKAYKFLNLMYSTTCMPH